MWLKGYRLMVLLLIKFTAETRTSGVVLKKDGTNIRKGQDAAKYCTSIRKYFPEIQLKSNQEFRLIAELNWYD
jgi:ligand-binding sensor protein